MPLFLADLETEQRFSNARRARRRVHAAGTVYGRPLAGRGPAIRFRS
jgi:hypothetical protein